MRRVPVLKPFRANFHLVLEVVQWNAFSNDSMSSSFLCAVQAVSEKGHTYLDLVQYR